MHYNKKTTTSISVRFCGHWLIACLLPVLCGAQTISKPTIDTTTLRQWESLVTGFHSRLTEDGQYYVYMTYQPGSYLPILHIGSTNTNWQTSAPNISNGHFSADSKCFVYSRKDTIGMIQLGKQERRYITGINSYKQSANGKWLAYTLLAEPSTLLLLNLLTGKTQHLENILSYHFSEQNDVLLLTRPGKLDWFDLTNEADYTIWVGDARQLGPITFSANGRQLCFIVKAPQDSSNAAQIWYYTRSMKSSQCLVNKFLPGEMPGLQVSNSPPGFDTYGKYIFFKVQEPSLPDKNLAMKYLNIWSWQDRELPSVQQTHVGQPVYTYAVSLATGHIVRVENRNEQMAYQAGPCNGDHVVVESTRSGDRFWMKKQDSVWLLSLHNAARTYLSNMADYTEPRFSPDGRFLVYYNRPANRYICYDTHTNLTKWLGSAGQFERTNDYMEGPSHLPAGIAGWIGNHTILLYDDHDIWQVTLEEESLPENLTNGYGYAHNIIFRLNDENGKRVFNNAETLLLVAFNETNKENGFFLKPLKKKGILQPLIMGPYTYCHLGRNLIPDKTLNNGMWPVYNKKTDTWLLLKQSCTEAPNLFITKTWKQFIPVTKLQPHKNWNWLTAELINWPQLDNSMTQGVLYKPENFDSTHKYPLIIYFYRQLSNYLYEYPEPALMSGGAINIPWFVSNGYLVLAVDIHFKPGQKGWSGLNAVESGAIQMGKLPYVDSNRIGISGHSNGGFQCNYICANSKRFAAAMSGAGVSDVVSSALSLIGESGEPVYSRLPGYEIIMEGSLWEKQEQYLENSAILKADQIITPLLMFHCKNDGSVPWTQAIELFIALRRQAKPVWLLQYENGGHLLSGKTEKTDLTIRVTQFFDHYLKNKPAPSWMEN